MKHIQFKLGPVRVRVSYGKPKTDSLRAHEIGHRLGGGHIPISGTVPYSTLKAPPKL